MRKFVIGLVLGAGLMMAVQAQAEGIRNFIGATIEGQFPVKVDGQVVSAPGIVIDGISYLPTRVIAELAGFDVTFDAGAGIELKRKSAAEQPVEAEETPPSSDETQEETPPEDKPDLSDQIRSIDKQINHLKLEIYTKSGILTQPNASEAAKDAAKLRISQLEMEINALEAQKAALELRTAP